MSLQFIIGGSGSGKTRRLYEDLIRQSIEEPEGRFFAIVPEQFTMQTQKDIVTLHPCHGVMNIDIVSFERLAYRIFEELAVENLAVLDDMGKSMVLRKVSSGVKKDLKLFGGHLEKAGFIGELKSMLSEFFQYGITEEKLEELAGDTESVLLRQKLNDMLVLYRAFKEYTEERMIAKEEILDLLCRVLPQSELIKSSVVTLDGYTGFTPIQYKLLELLLVYCRKVVVTVTMDLMESPYKEGSMQSLFHMSRHTVCRLIDLAAAAGCSREEDILLDGRPCWRFKDSPELQFIETELFRCHGARYEGGAKREALFLCQADNPLREVEFLSGEIERLVKQEGYRYRDIAVITGDLETYSREMVRQFAENQIPCFIDFKKNIMGNPMVELIRSALEVLQESFSYESVFRYLKTGLALSEDAWSSAWEERLRRAALPGSEPDSTGAWEEKPLCGPAEEPSSGCVTEDSSPPHTAKELLYLTENYVLALGIRGFKRWNAEWDFVYRGSELLNLEELNAFRVMILQPFLPLKEVFSDRGTTVREKTEALVHFLEALHIEEKMQEYEAAFRAEGEVSLEKEYSQIYGLVMDLFDRVTALLGDEKAGRKEYCEILDAGFAEIKVGLIPAVVDRVVVGDITRTRLSHIKVLFFAGVNDGIVPAVSGRGGILSEAERGSLKRRQVELAPTAREEGFLQRFYLYLALTKASDRLYLSYCASSAEGKSLRPSSLIGQLRKLFPEKQVRVPDRREMAYWSLPLGLRQVIENLRDCRSGKKPGGGDGSFQELYRFFYSSEEYREEMERLVRAAFSTYEDRGIGRTAAREIYSQILHGSVTRMELYAACAYAHFLAYGLELSERPVYELAAADIGNLFHGAIDRYFKRMKEENRSFSGISEEDRKRLVAECVSDVTEDYGNTILKSSSRNQYLERKVHRITDRTIWALTEQLKKGDFEPSGFEVSFSPSDNLRAMKIPVSGEEAIHLKGRIDRIDLCEDGDLLYLKIIDYKTGMTKFDLTETYYGLQMQLIVYMDAAMEKVQRSYPDKKVVPAGIFYYHIDDPMVERKDGEEEEQTKAEILKQLRMNGLVNGRPEALKHLDNRLDLGSKEAVDSAVVPVSLKNEEIVQRRSSVAGEKRFEALGTFVNRKLKAMGREILNGRISVAPYKSGTRTACDYCPYHSVCGFDLKTEGYGFRRFDSLSTDEVWEKIEETAKNGRPDGERIWPERTEGSEKQQEERREDGHGGELDERTETGN